MPKGRIYAPPTASDGLWFEHRGLPNTGPVMRKSHTSTGVMLTSPYSNELSWYPPGPPNHYLEKSTGHDSRTLGKHLLSSDQRQHNTDKDFLKHNGREVINYSYHTNYHNSYEGRPSANPPTRRRFPKIYKEGDPSATKLDTATTDWFREPDVPHKTPTHVLAVSQEPFLPKNSWKYSYHGKSKLYPPYDKVNGKKPFSSWHVHGVPSTKEVATS